MVIDNNPIAQRPSRGWAEHREARDGRVVLAWLESHVAVPVKRNVRLHATFDLVPTLQTITSKKTGKTRTRYAGDTYVITSTGTKSQADWEFRRVCATSYRQEGAVKVDRVKPDRIGRRAERMAEKKADWPELPNPNAKRDQDWAKARREAKLKQKALAIQLRLAG